MRNPTQADIDEALERTRKLCPPGKTIYTVLEHVSASGMTRWIKCYTIDGDELAFLSGYIETLTGYMRDKTGPRDGNKIAGCGMDMGYAIVYDLGRKLYPNGAPGTDPHALRDGGYALKHRWL